MNKNFCKPMKIETTGVVCRLLKTPTACLGSNTQTGLPKKQHLDLLPEVNSKTCCMDTGVEKRQRSIVRMGPKKRVARRLERR